MTDIPFNKIEGTGNDFILVDNRSRLIDPAALPQLTPILCNRKYGVGSDGLILLEEDESGGLVMVYKNPDGSDAGMCGNGARCFTLFAHRIGYEREIDFRVHDNRYQARLKGTNVTIRFPLETTAEPIQVDGEEFLNVYTNTEHIVCQVAAERLEEPARLMDLGRTLRNHNAFSPAGTNVNFICGTGETELKLQTYERGVENFTLACGTGAIASALAWHSLQGEGEGSFEYQVHTQGGFLLVRFTFLRKSHTYRDVELEGPATFVFEGRYPWNPADIAGNENGITGIRS